MSDYDVNAKLHPPLPTPPDEQCQCQERPALKLMSALGYNPLHCIDCNLEVPPDQLSLASELVEAIADWRNLYDAIDRLWIDSGEYEHWAKAQLADIRSPVNLRGLALQARINAHVERCYYWYFQDEAEESFQPITHCPRCGVVLVEYRNGIFPQRICEHCSLITVSE